MPQKSPYKIILTGHEKCSLQEMVRKYTLPYYKVVRAKIILLAAQGIQNKEIGHRLDIPRRIVSKWRKRFFCQRLEGLEDQPREGRPRVFFP